MKTSFFVNRRMAQVVFQKLGWEVETVDSGDRAQWRRLHHYS